MSDTEVAGNTAKETVKEILDSRRSFLFESEDNDPVEYFIANPAGEDIRMSDWNYSKVFNQAMIDGFPTQSQMIDILKERSILDDDYTQDVEKTRISLAAALFRLENMSDDLDDSETEGIAIEVAQLRDKLFQLNQKVNGPLGNTCENLAEDARTEFLTSRVIEKKDGSKVWSTFEDFRTSPNTTLTVKSRFEVMLWLQGLDSNFLENTPEQSALRGIAQKRMDDAIAQAQEELSEATPTPEIEELSVDAVEVKPPKKVKKKAAPKKKAAKKKSGRPKGSKNKKDKESVDAKDS